MKQQKRWDKKLKGNKSIGIFATVILVLFSFSVTFLSEKIPIIPTWDEVYSFFGIVDENAYGEPEKLDFEPMPLTLTVLDVGQGESIFIYDESGTSILVDTGEDGNAKKIINYMKLFGVKELDYLIITHPHTDHMGSAAEVMSNVSIKNILTPYISKSIEPNSSYYKKFKSATENSGANATTAVAGDELNLGDMRLTFLGPLSQSENLNNMSLVIRLDYGETSFLLMGDAESEEEIQILKAYPATALTADVLVVSHHGSDSSSTYEFVEAVYPKIAAISCGRDNAYGHPHQATLNTLDLLKTEIHRTDEKGNIAVGSDGKKLIVLR